MASKPETEKSTAEPVAKKTGTDKSSTDNTAKKTEAVKSNVNITAKIPKNFKSTAEVKVSEKLIGQILGQDKAVEIIKKASQQRRNVLLIGEPGTGKSLLGLALAELLPKEKLVDIISFPNPNDENTPLIRTIPAGQGRDLIARSKIQGMNMLKNQNIILFILVIVAMFAPWLMFNYYGNRYDFTVGAIIFGASFVGSFLFLAAFVIFLNLGKRMEGRAKSPKVIVDNFKKKQAPFFDATGSHAGALLGDVLHDPFQSFSYTSIQKCISKENVFLGKKFELVFDKFKRRIEKRNEKQNYEAIHLPKNELFVQGETNGSVSPVEVLSSNRYDHTGEMIKLTTSENKELIITPEHKIAVWKNNKIAYVEANHIRENDEIVSTAENIIIDEQDIINTYPQEQQDLAKSYYQYIELKEQNPTWGYKRIATKLGVSYGRTRWWWDNKSAPYPIQTVEYLKKNELLPLKIENPNLLLISKVLGATYGDGGIFENLNGIFLSSSEKEAVQEFGKDLEKIFNLNENENSRIIEAGEYGHSWCYQNTNRNIIRFFLALGAPKGNKTNIKLKIPKWISLNEKFEHEFFGSFFGGEIGTPIIHKSGNHLTTLELGITGKKEFEENRYEFLGKVSSYLLKNRILTTSIYRKELNRDSIIYRLQIDKKFDNVLLFLMNVKINYCKYKIDRLYKALGNWALHKKNKYNELIYTGHGAEYAMKILNLTPNSLYLLLNHFGPKEAET